MHIVTLWWIQYFYCALHTTVFYTVVQRLMCAVAFLVLYLYYTLKSVSDKTLLLRVTLITLTENRKANGIWHNESFDNTRIVCLSFKSGWRISFAFNILYLKKYFFRKLHITLHLPNFFNSKNKQKTLNLRRNICKRKFAHKYVKII